MLINDFLSKQKKRYIIAEVSQNHDGSLGQAHAFIDAVAKTGADAIKFQTHIAAEESTAFEPFRVKFSYADQTRYDYWKRMEFTPEQWKGLYDHAQERGLDFLSSPFSVAALDMLEQIGVPAWKFGSGEVFNNVLIDRAINTGKPLILSTGMSTMADIDAQVRRVLQAGNQLILMECTTAYPSRAEEIPIAMISKYLARYDNVPIGISDHSATVFPSIAAATLGATVFEMHVTMSRDMFGPDVKASVTMDELSEIARGVDFVQTMLACKRDKEQLSDELQGLKRIFSKSIYAKKPISAGECLTEDNIAIKKPHDEGGIPVERYYQVLNSRAVRNINTDECISWECIEQ